jgi:hypothetical protein
MKPMQVLGFLFLGIIGFAAMPNIEEIESSFTIDMREGWNLISFPVENAMIVENTCTGGVFYGFDPLTAHYVKKNLNSDLKKVMNGFWFKAESPCSITVTGSEVLNVSKLRVNERLLRKGWNMIGSASESLNWEEIKGACNVIYGPLWFDVESTTSFLPTDTLEPGKGYFVKVDRTCWLGDRPGQSMQGGR